MAMLRPASEMKDSGVKWLGLIPKNWNIIRFKFVHIGANVGMSIDRDYWSDDENDTAFYTAQIKPIHVRYDGFPEWKYTSENDLLLARNATPYVYLPVLKAAYTDHIIRVDIKPLFDRRYIRYCLQQSIAYDVADGVSLPTWSVSIWNRQVIPFLSTNEQQAIADYLDDRCSKIDEILAEATASIEEYKALKQSVIFEAVTKGLDKNVPMKDSGIEWLPHVPQHWDVRRIASIYDESKETGRDDLPILLVSIHTGISDREIEDDERDRKVIRSEDKTVYKVVHKNNLAYNMMRAWQGGFGAATVDGLVSPAYVVAKPKIDVNSAYIENVLRTPNAIEHIRGLSYGVADFRLRLYWPYFKNIRVPFPPVAEQDRIVAFIQEKAVKMDALISEKQALIDDLLAYKKSLIYEVVTGKRRVV